MEDRQSILKKLSAKVYLGDLVSINDLREKELIGQSLSDDEKLALYTFDRFRIAELNKQETDSAFHERYRQLQVMANLGEYSEFLKEKYRV